MVAKVNAASVPRSERILGRGNCLATDDVQDCVRITGPKVSNRFQVTKVAPDVLGEDQAGKRYWIGADSKLTTSIGVPAVGGVFHLQFMGVATSDDEILIDPHVPVKRRG